MVRETGSGGLITELLLLLEEGAVQGVGKGVVEELEAVEDLNSSASLDADDASEYADGSRSTAAASAIISVMRLGLEAGVVIRDVDDHQRVELEGQPAARRRGRHRCAAPLFAAAAARVEERTRSSSALLSLFFSPLLKVRSNLSFILFYFILSNSFKIILKIQLTA